MTAFIIDPRQKKIVNSFGQVIGLPINDFGSRSEIEVTGFTYSSSLSIALYIIRPDLRDGQTMPVYYGTTWTEANGAYKHTMKYGKDYFYSVTQNDSLARLVIVADSEVILDQEVLIDTISSYSDDAESLPTSGGGGGSTSATWGQITGTLSAQTDLINALNAKAKASDLTALSGQVQTLSTTVNSKASASDLSTLSGQVQSLTTTVNSKAAASDLTALSAKVTTLSGVVNTKASTADLVALSGEIYSVIGDVETLLSNI